jgi:tRNA A37 threonylcarbamoyladenosine dehydratase
MKKFLFFIMSLAWIKGMFVLGTAAGLIISALFSKKKKEKHHLEKELSNVNQRQFNSKGPEYETLKQ